MLNRQRRLVILIIAIAMAIAWSASATPAIAAPPPAPSGIAVSAADENTVNVIWTAHPDGAKDYRLAWKPAGES